MAVEHLRLLDVGHQARHRLVIGEHGPGPGLGYGHHHRCPVVALAARQHRIGQGSLDWPIRAAVLGQELGWGRQTQAHCST